ncbi:UNVERIFIED_CONTAM: hypothetical protein H355_010591, partial [Colinus virginianus]
SVYAGILPRAKQILFPLDSEVVVPHLQELQNPCDSPPVGQLSQVYWSNQCEVTTDRIEYIVFPCIFSVSDWIRSSPELLYTPTGLEMMPSYQPPVRGTVIYLGEEGNIVHVLTIANSPESGKHTKRKAVILTARVHPRETNSSWIMKGILDYILGNSGKPQQLRDTFIFKVVPMLNPDGVTVGNQRCSLTGYDLNHKYKSKVKKSYPSIWYTRNMIRR